MSSQMGSSDMGTHSDVKELSLLLQCLGYSVKSMQVNDGNFSQDNTGAKTLTINCPISGYTVVLENRMAWCSCPAADNDHSGLWSVTGVAQGKTAPQESGHGLIGTVPKEHRERLSKELHHMIHSISDLRDQSCSSSQVSLSKSASTGMLEMTSPEKENYLLKVDAPMSPLRYRSLDALTVTGNDGDLPMPGVLTKGPVVKTRRSIIRQETYTVKRPNIPNFVANKTSSPIKSSVNQLELLKTSVNELELSLQLAVEKMTSEMQQKLSLTISELMEANVDANDSMASLSLDMSKISVQQPEPAKYQFSSSPNLSGLSRDGMRSSLKRTESASSSKLGATKIEFTKNPKMSRLRRLSPNFFKGKKNSPTQAQAQADVPLNKNQEEGKSKVRNLFKRSDAVTSDSNISFTSINKNKYSHIKSTIPRATPSPTLIPRATPSPIPPRK